MVPSRQEFEIDIGFTKLDACDARYSFVTPIGKHSASDEHCLSRYERYISIYEIHQASKRALTVREDSESSSVGSYLYRFGHFVLDLRRRTLSRADSPVFLTRKAFDVLSSGTTTFAEPSQKGRKLTCSRACLLASWSMRFARFTREKG